MENKTIQPLVEVVKEKKLTNEQVVTSPEENDSETLTNNNAFNTFRAIDLNNDNESSDSSQETEETEESEKNTVSDGRVKYGACLEGSDLLNLIAQLDSYVYKYNDTAKSIPSAEEKGVDDKTHVGILAQELKANPITESTVKEDPLSGFLTIDTNSLTLTQQAILNAMAKRIIALEKEVYSGRQ